MTSLARLLIVVALLVCPSCAVIGATAGAGGGFLLGGPPGAIGGSAGGAWIGDWIAGGQRTQEALDQERKESAELRADLVEARASARANEKILEHNLKLPRGEQPVPLVSTPEHRGGDANYSRSFWNRTPASYVFELVGGIFR